MGSGFPLHGWLEAPRDSHACVGSVYQLSGELYQDAITTGGSQDLAVVCVCLSEAAAHPASRGPGKVLPLSVLRSPRPPQHEGFSQAAADEIQSRRHTEGPYGTPGDLLHHW